MLLSIIFDILRLVYDYYSPFLMSDTFSDLLTTSDEDLACRLEDIRLDGFDEYPNNSVSNLKTYSTIYPIHCGQEKDSDIDNYVASSSTAAQRFYSSDYDAPILNGVACMYCQKEYPIDRLDTHEVIFLLTNIYSVLIRTENFSHLNAPFSSVLLIIRQHYRVLQKKQE